MSLWTDTPNTVLGELHGRNSKNSNTFSISVDQTVLKAGLFTICFSINFGRTSSQQSINALELMVGVRISKSYSIYLER